MILITGTQKAYLPVVGKTPAEDVLKGLVEFAEKKENWFGNPDESAEAAKTRTDPRPEGGFHAPAARHIKVKDAASGDDLEYHVSFTITVAKMMSKTEGGDVFEDVLLRHATIGVGDLSRYVNDLESFAILRFLGFKGMDPLTTEHPDFMARVFFEPVS